MKFSWRDICIGVFGNVVDDDVPVFSIGIVGPVPEEKFVGHMGLYGSLCFPFISFGICLSVGPTDSGPHLSGKGDEVAVG